MSSFDDDAWFKRAACEGYAPMFDPPEPMPRSLTGTQREIAKAAEEERLHRLSLICKRCPVADRCEQDWKPGRDEGYRNGRQLPPIEKQRGRGTDQKHGTEGGYKTHRRRGEQACFECREANRLGRAARGWRYVS